MAEYSAVASVGASIEALLTRAFTDPQSTPPVPDAITTAVLTRPGHAWPLGLLTPPALSVLLYRVAVSPVIRNTTPMPRSGGLGGTSIALNLHYLLTAWADDAVAEQRIIARALQALEQTPMLSGPLLDPATEWGPDDAVQLVSEDLPLEQLLKLHELGATELRPSICFVARVSRFDIRAATL